MALVRGLAKIKIPGLSQIVPILAVLMEAFWAYAWLVWLSKWPAWGWEKPPMSLAGCIIQIVVTEVLARAALNGKWSLKKVRAVVLPASFILLALIVRWSNGTGYSFADPGWFRYAGEHLSSLIAALIFGVFLIWRGIAAAPQKFGFDDLYRRFIIGMVFLVILLIVWGTVGAVKNIWSAAGIYVILFFGTGLLALAVANLETLREELLKYREDTSSFGRRWLSMLAALILAILGLSIALASIFSTNIWSSLLHGLSILGDWLLVVLSYVLLPVGYLLEGLIYVFRWLISLLRSDQTPPQFNMPDLSDLQKAAEGQSPVQIPVWLILLLKWGGVIIVAGLVVFILGRMLVRYWEGRPEKEVEEEHETLWSWGLLRKDLGLLLSWLFGWVKRFRSRRIQQAEAFSLPEAIQNERSSRTFSIRELYQALLWQGRQRGVPRKKFETPYEYRSRLVHRIQNGEDEINQLTEAYIFERYGEVRTEPERITFLNRVWRVLRDKITHGEDQAS